jgi:hypothetical protein
MLTNLLMYRLLIWNAIGIAAVIWAWLHGYVQILFKGETTGIGYLMVAVFVVGLASLCARARKVSIGLNDLKQRRIVDASKFAIKNSHIGHIAVWLVTLGLIGNMFGFAHAVEGMDVSSATEALHSVSIMIAGMKIAFYTTLIGTSLGLWLQVNFVMLSTATALLQKDAGQ